MLGLSALYRKGKIAVSDIAAFNKEKSKIFKGHSEIISLFTSRPKCQLTRMNKTKDTIVTEVKQVSDAYGYFLSCVMMPSASMAGILIDKTCSGIGCDEKSVVKLLCSCSPYEFVDIESYLKEINGNKFELSKFLNGKLSKDPILRSLIDEVLKSIRSNLDIYSNIEETAAKLFA